MSRLCMLLAAGLLSWGCRRSAPEPHFEQPTAPEPAPAAPDQPTKSEKAQDQPKALTQAAATPSAAPAKAQVREPTSPDPLKGKFTLAQATQGLEGKGPLKATIDTGYGSLECTLFDDKTPITVANFVGLARGLRPFWDAREAKWVKRPLYDGTSFHRAVAGFMIQGGDHLGDGTGTVGYDVPDELVAGLTHDRAGLLCMAYRGPNTNGGQFFITDGAAPHLTQMKTYTIFGECKPLDVIHRIASAPRPHPASERPEPKIPINKVTITRGK